MNLEQRNNLRKLLLDVIAYAQVNKHINRLEVEALIQYISDQEAYRIVQEKYNQLDNRK